MMPRSYRTELLLTAIIIGAVLFVALFNDINREIRVKELKVFLQKSEGDDNNLDHIGLVMKYRLNKRLYENQITEDKADLVEASVNSLLADVPFKNELILEKYSIFSVPAIYAINFFRAIIGKNSIQNLEKTRANIYFEIAYYYERNKIYNRALEIYNRALNEEEIDRTVRAGIILHMAFCQSMSGHYGRAEEDYTRIIDEYSDEKAAITAAILHRYLKGFKSEAERVLKNEKDSPGKGEKLYQLTAYKESLQVLENIEKDASVSETPRIRFYKARCMEELSEKEKAINIYQKIVIENEISDYAKYANRRLYIIGSLAHNGGPVKQMAVKNNELLDDDVFDKIMDETCNPEPGISIKEKAGKSEGFQKIFTDMLIDYPVLNEERIENVEKSMAIVDEKLKKRDRKEGKKKKRKKKKGAAMPGIKILTAEGNIYAGKVLRETDDVIFIKTMSGKVKIEKNRIKKREKIY